MVTINEIAKIVGVSKATVSNVFTKKKKVSFEVTRRILEVCEQLNYYPNRMAAGLTTKKMNILGLLLNDEGSVIKKFQKDIIGGVLQASYKSGYRLMIDMCTLDDKVIYNSLISRSDPIDGAIIAKPLLHDDRVKMMIDKNVPFVLIGSPPKEFGDDILYVDVDNVDLVYRTVLSLIKLGHVNIGFLNSQPNTTISFDRMDGFKKALKECGYSFDLTYVYDTDNTASTGKTAVRELLSNHPDVTAIITSSDDVAVGVYEVLESQGICIPKQMSIIALGGDDYIDRLYPRPTTAIIDYNVLGMEAVGLLMNKIMNKPIVNNKVIASIQIVEGQSTAPFLDHD